MSCYNFLYIESFFLVIEFLELDNIEESEKKVAETAEKSTPSIVRIRHNVKNYEIHKTSTTLSGILDQKIYKVIRKF